MRRAITATSVYKDGLPIVVEAAAVNSPPGGSVTITGIPTEGETLTLVDTLTDADGMDVRSYQLRRDGVPIPGATSTTYTLIQADVGATAIDATWSYVDGAGNPHSGTTNAVGPIVSPPTENRQIFLARDDATTNWGFPLFLPFVDDMAKRYENQGDLDTAIQGLYPGAVWDAGSVSYNQPVASTEPDVNIVVHDEPEFDLQRSSSMFSTAQSGGSSGSTKWPFVYSGGTPTAAENSMATTGIGYRPWMHDVGDPVNLRHHFQQGYAYEIEFDFVLGLTADTWLPAGLINDGDSWITLYQHHAIVDTGDTHQSPNLSLRIINWGTEGPRFQLRSRGGEELINTPANIILDVIEFGQGQLTGGSIHNFRIRYQPSSYNAGTYPSGGTGINNDDGFTELFHNGAEVYSRDKFNNWKGTHSHHWKHNRNRISKGPELSYYCGQLFDPPSNAGIEYRNFRLRHTNGTGIPEQIPLSNDPPAIVPPGNQTNLQSDEGISLQLTLSQGSGVTWSDMLNTLPDGLAIDPSTGLITGDINAFAGTYIVQITATNADGSDQEEFIWTIT